MQENEQAKIYRSTKPLTLEGGATLPEWQLAYHTYGSLNAAKDNVIWVCHALTANSDVADWWEGLFGEGKLLDPQRYFIVCANMLGSCYGSTHALSVNPESQESYYHDFPLLSIRDMAQALEHLREYLEIEKIALLIGGSMGGQHAMEWAYQAPTRFERLILLATNARHSPWGIAFNESQRMAIQADASWQYKHPQAGLAGLKAARAIALLSYRNYRTYQQSQQEEASALEGFRAASYQQYQGEKLTKRFNAFSYWTLSKAMDSHDLGRGRGPLEEVLQGISAKTLVIGISSDLLFPPEEQRFLARHIPDACYEEIDSLFGHDGFLIEAYQITKAVRRWELVKALEV